jgi:abortive infection bacteriophage resistance protein
MPVTPLNDAHHDGLFLCLKKNYIKPALTVSEQLIFLKSQGLYIDDQEQAMLALKTVSYYRLSSYLLPFKQSHHVNSPRRFKENTSFKNIWQLYQFDRELRLLVSDAIEKIEVAFRAALTNVTSIWFHPFWYVERHYFRTNARASKGKDFFDNYLKVIKAISISKQELFIQHYHNRYNSPCYPPMAMLTK